MRVYSEHLGSNIIAMINYDIYSSGKSKLRDELEHKFCKTAEMCGFASFSIWSQQYLCIYIVFGGFARAVLI